MTEGNAYNRLALAHHVGRCESSVMSAATSTKIDAVDSDGMNTLHEFLKAPWGGFGIAVSV